MRVVVAWLCRWLLLGLVAALVVLAFWMCATRPVEVVDTSAGFAPRQKTGVPFERYLEYHSKKLGVRPEDQVESP